MAVQFFESQCYSREINQDLIFFELFVLQKHLGESTLIRPNTPYVNLLLLYPQICQFLNKRTVNFLLKFIFLRHFFPFPLCQLNFDRFLRKIAINRVDFLNLAVLYASIDKIWEIFNNHYY